jgi:hypothetical protein
MFIYFGITLFKCDVVTPTATTCFDSRKEIILISLLEIYGYVANFIVFPVGFHFDSF